MGKRKKILASRAAKVLSSMGASLGGKARAASLTPEERRAKAKAMAAARWKGNGPTVAQQQVLNRLNGRTLVTLQIAPGPGGARRRSAIETLRDAGRLVVAADRGHEIDVFEP